MLDLREKKMTGLVLQAVFLLRTSFLKVIQNNLADKESPPL
jgi:hypothetical protein